VRPRAVTRVVAACCALLVSGVPLFARDFMERPQAVVFNSRIAPGTTIVPLPAVYTETAFDYQLFRFSAEDKFQIRQFSHVGIADFGRLRTSIYYGTILLSGPVNEGDVPGAEAAQWMMNAIQYEYGLTAQLPIGGWVALVEYGRRSFHPLRSGFGQPAADIVRGGVAPPVIAPAIARGALTVETLYRIGWADLYDFWGSDLPLPRVEYAFHQAYDVRYTVGWGGPFTLEPFTIAMIDTNLRRTGGVDSDLSVKGGLSVTTPGGAWFELYLDWYRSPDTEQRAQVTPARLFGYGFSFCFATPKRLP
jgi:hypothetical protein